MSKRVAEVKEKIAQKYKELHKQQKAHTQAVRTIPTGMDTLAREQVRTRYEIERLKALPRQITVLFLAANPLPQAQLRLDEEARAIREQLRLSDFRDSIKFESRWTVRP